MTDARWLELWHFAGVVASHACRTAPWLERDELTSQALEVLVARELRGTQPVRAHRKLVMWMAMDLLRAQPDEMQLFEEPEDGLVFLKHALTPEFACLLREETAVLEGAGRDGAIDAPAYRAHVLNQLVGIGCAQVRAGCYSTAEARLVMFL